MPGNNAYTVHRLINFRKVRQTSTNPTVRIAERQHQYFSSRASKPQSFDKANIKGIKVHQQSYYTDIALKFMPENEVNDLVERIHCNKEEGKKHDMKGVSEPIPSRNIRPALSIITDTFLEKAVIKHDDLERVTEMNEKPSSSSVEDNDENAIVIGNNNMFTTRQDIYQPPISSSLFSASNESCTIGTTQEQNFELVDEIESLRNRVDVVEKTLCGIIKVINLAVEG